jgi:hypothetical protein
VIAEPPPAFAAGLHLDVDDRFTADHLDSRIWIPHYLPHWSTPARSAARFDLTGGGDSSGGLRLRIDADQSSWRDDEGGLRVSNLQTATFSGALGSPRGTHRHRSDLAVSTEVPHRELWAPSSGAVEVELIAPADPRCLTAVWLVGVEAGSPDDSGEITVVELFGDRIGAAASTVRTGVKAINDPRLHDDLVDLELPWDAREPHRYGAAWNAAGVRLFVDGELVHDSPQSLGYPMQLMIDLFELPAGSDDDSDVASDDVGGYPRTATVARVRCYS